MPTHTFSLIITAAGSGQRYQSTTNKVFDLLHGIPTIIHSIRNTQHPQISQTIITISASEFEQLTQVLDAYSIIAEIVIGGPTRLESVQNGLSKVNPNCTGVLIHDAARPNPSAQLIQTLIETAPHHTAIIPGIAISDTIKQIENDTVVKTIPRASLRAIQTPQYFSKGVYGHLLNMKGSSEITDEAMILEIEKIPIHTIEGDTGNVKLTRPSDKLILEVLMRPN